MDVGKTTFQIQSSSTEIPLNESQSSMKDTKSLSKKHRYFNNNKLIGYYLMIYL